MHAMPFNTIKGVLPGGAFKNIYSMVFGYFFYAPKTLKKASFFGMTV